MTLLNGALFCLSRGKLGKRGVGSLQRLINEGNTALLETKHSMRAESTKKEKKMEESQFGLHFSAATVFF